MPEKQLTEAQHAHIRAEAEETAHVLSSADQDQLDMLVAMELMPSAAMVVGLKMISRDRGWSQEQFWKALLYTVLRQRRAIRESENI
jgi:hypothetical protein